MKFCIGPNTPLTNEGEIPCRMYSKGKIGHFWPMEQDNSKGSDLIPFTSTSALGTINRSRIQKQKYGLKSPSRKNIFMDTCWKMGLLYMTHTHRHWRAYSHVLTRELLSIQLGLILCIEYGWSNGLSNWMLAYLTLDSAIKIQDINDLSECKF